MGQLKKYLLVVLLFIIPEIHAQLNEFMIMWYQNEASNNNSSAPWKTGYSPFLSTMKTTYNFNTVYFEYQVNQTPINSDLIPIANTNGLKSIIRSEPLHSWVANLNDPTNFNKHNADSAFGKYNLNGIIGYNIIDEPFEISSYYSGDSKNTNKIEYILDYANVIRDSNQFLLRWSNLLCAYAYSKDKIYRQEYLQKYIDITKPNILSFDEYPLAYKVDSFKHIIFFKTLYDFAIKSVENSIPFIYVLTPYKYISDYDGSVSPEDLTIPAISKSEFSYVIYAALAYGAKGLAYWPGFEWVKNNNNDILKLKYDTVALDYIKSLHGKLLTSSDELLSLNFASAYHTSKISTIGSPYNEEIHDFCLWENFKNDKYAKLIFDIDNPVYEVVTTDTGTDYQNTPSELAITFLTNSSGKIYYWLFNKSLTRPMTLDLVVFSEIMDVLNNNQIVETGENGLPEIMLNPGEAKLFTANSTPEPQTYIEKGDITYQANFYPFELAGQINLGGYTYGKVNFEDESTKSFMAHNIVILPGVAIKQGSTVRLSAYKDCNTIHTTSAPSAAPRKKDVVTEQTPMVEPKVYPNPTRDNFLIKTSLKENEEIEVRVYDNVGRIIKVTKVLSEETIISLQNEPTGIFFVRFTQNDKIYSYKIVKL